jgi:hypothetical protein
MIFTFIPHHCIFPPSVRLSVYWLPSFQSPNDPNDSQGFRGNRFEFLLEIFTPSSRRFDHDPPTIKASRVIDAPHRSIVVASIRLVTQNDYGTHNIAGGRVDPGYVFSGIVSRLGCCVIIPSCSRVILGNGRAKRFPFGA